MEQRRLKGGDRVQHDFSRTRGTIKAVVKGDHQCPYYVEWDNGKKDWYSGRVLELEQFYDYKYALDKAELGDHFLESEYGSTIYGTVITEPEERDGYLSFEAKMSDGRTVRYGGSLENRAYWPTIVGIRELPCPMCNGSGWIRGKDVSHDERVTCPECLRKELKTSGTRT